MTDEREKRRTDMRAGAHGTAVQGSDRSDGVGDVGEVPVGSGQPTRVAGRARVRWRRLSVGAVVLLGLVAVLLIGQASGAQAAAAGGIAEVKSFATKLTGYVTAIAASVAILFMAVNGLRWTMSSGNPMRQAEARNGLVAAAAGLAIALSAGVIVNLVIAALN